MNIYENLDTAMANLAGFLWGTPLVVLLLGGGIFFAGYSRFVPMLYSKHGIDILLGKYDSDDDPGQITHFEALSSALAGTVGMGNIAGVAVAINTGGPGAVFWMWVTAILGMSTKFFTCTLALMYQGEDDQGEIQGGVMYPKNILTFPLVDLTCFSISKTKHIIQKKLSKYFFNTKI